MKFDPTTVTEDDGKRFASEQLDRLCTKISSGCGEEPSSFSGQTNSSDDKRSSQ